jgi:Reverse transcriptase (RNA-dependent DNA polymerase)
MIDLKAGFHNIPFEHKSSYDSMFVTHRGKFTWLRMPMRLTQAPAHFQFVVEDVLKGEPADRRLPVVVYLDDIAVFGDDQT